MDRESITLFTRVERGKNAVRRLLKNGFVPAVIYGHNKPTIMVKVGEKEVKKIQKNKGRAVYYVVEDGDDILKGKKVFVKEVAKNYLTDEIRHIDFYEMSDKELTKVTVPIKLVGKAEGLVLGGVLEWEKREVEIKALPEDVPDCIEVDVTHLNIGHSIHLSDIKLPENVHLAEDSKISVVTMLAPRTEVELTPEEKEAKLKASLAGEEGEEKEKEK